MGKRSLVFGCYLSTVLACALASAETLRGGGALWYPFSYQDAEGRATGIAVDVVRQVMRQSDLQVEFLFYPANRLNLLLDDGDLDLNYADSPQWNSADAATRFVYSKPYLRVREHLYFLADHPSRDLPLSHLHGLRIGTIRGYTYPALDQAMASERLVRVQTSEDDMLLQLLVLGRVDAIAMVDDVFDYQLKARALEPRRFHRAQLLDDAALTIKLQRRHAAHLPALDRALQKLVDSGEVQRIRQRYLRTGGALPAGQARAPVAAGQQDPPAAEASR